MEARKYFSGVLFGAAFGAFLTTALFIGKDLFFNKAYLTRHDKDNDGKRELYLGLNPK